MLATLKVLALAFFDICRFKRRPQDIPRSLDLMSLSLFFYLAVATLLLLFTESVGRSLLSAGVELGMLLLFTYGLLAISGKASRWVQTMTAMSGTGVVLSLIAIPVYAVLGFYSVNDAGSQPLNTLAMMVLAALALWNIAVMAFILREALEVGMFTGIMLAIAYIWLILSVSNAMFPAEYG